jgi:hypothetical protein
MKLNIFLVSSFCHRRRRKTNFNLPNSKPIDIGLRGRFILTSHSLWSHLSTTKWRTNRRNLFHDDNIILSENIILHVVMRRKLRPSPLLLSSSSKPLWRDQIHHSSSLLSERKRRKPNPQYKKLCMEKIKPKLGLDLLNY